MSRVILISKSKCLGDQVRETKFLLKYFSSNYVCMQSIFDKFAI